MARVKITTTIEEDILVKLQVLSKDLGLRGYNDILEASCRLYFANVCTEVWEKPLKGGWLKKLIISSNKAIYECIRQRKVYEIKNAKYYTQDFLENKGFKRVWKIKSKE